MKTTRPPLLMIFLLFSSSCDFLRPKDGPQFENLSLHKMFAIDGQTGAKMVLREDARIWSAHFVLDGSHVVYREDYHHAFINGIAREVKEPALKMVKIDGTGDDVLVRGKIRDPEVPYRTFGIPAISPDGRKAAVITDDSVGTGYSLSVVDLQTKTVIRLQSFSDPLVARDPCFTSDGTRVVYVEITGAGTSSLIALNIQTAARTVIRSSNTTKFLFPQFIPLQNKIMYFESRYSGTYASFYVINDDGSNLLFIGNVSQVSEGSLPAASPDGSLIVYNDCIDGGTCLVRPDGTRMKVIGMRVKQFMQNSDEVLITTPYSSGVFNLMSGSFTQLPFDLPVFAFSPQTNTFLAAEAYERTIQRGG